jgi:hypothetical protein
MNLSHSLMQNAAALTERIKRQAFDVTQIANPSPTLVTVCHVSLVTTPLDDDHTVVENLPIRHLGLVRAVCPARQSAATQKDVGTLPANGAPSVIYG